MSTILIVDDDPHLRELSRIFLHQEGFTIAEACDGVEALAKIECSKVDLVILDIMMPKMDGWEMCRRLRRDYDIPVLMLTAKDSMSDVVRGRRPGPPRGSHAPRGREDRPPK